MMVVIQPGDKNISLRDAFAYTGIHIVAYAHANDPGHSATVTCSPYLPQFCCFFSLFSLS